MTPPPPAVTHAASSSVAIPARTSHQRTVAGTLARLIEPRAWARTRLLVDVVVLYMASSAALFAVTPIRVVPDNRWIAAIFPFVVIALMRIRRSPDERLNGSLVDTCAHVVGVVSLTTMLTIALDAIIGARHPVGMAIRLWLFSTVYLGAARAVLLSIRRQAVASSLLATPTLIVGAGRVGDHLVNRLVSDPGYGLRPVGYLDADPLPRDGSAASSPIPILGGPDRLEEAIHQTSARHVILAFSTEPDHVLVGRIRKCEALGIDVSVVPRLYESINQRSTLDHVGGLPLLSLRPTNPRGWQFAVKHGLDRGIALLMLLAAGPLMLAISLAIRINGSPVLFRQRRVGRDGREFDVLKFRTMHDGAGAEEEFLLPEGVAPGGIEGADRRTPLGRLLRATSLDELPQFINVLRGEMSIVGPRPERPEYVRRFTAEIMRYGDRHRVKSGITGWAQVNGLRGQTSIADRVEWDNHYIQNWSLRMDARILALTFAEVLRFRSSG